jgi:hypothetical protein
MLLGEEVMLLTDVGITVTGTVLVTPEPSVADIVILIGPPTPTPVTRPLALTVAIEVLLEVYVTALTVAFVGSMVGVSCCVPVTSRFVMLLGEAVMLLTEVGITVTGTVLVTPEPSVADIVILIGPPTPTPVTRPLALTVAIEVLLEV